MINHHFAHTIGCLITGFGTALSALLWSLGRWLPSPPALFADLPAESSGAQAAATWTVAIGVFTLVFNAVMAERKSRIEADARLAERKLDAAKVLADAELANLHAEINALRAGRGERRSADG